MADRSAIEWTEATWNPVSGCSKVSPGCAHCYAETISLRFRHSLKPWTPENAKENVRLHEGRIDQPLRWRRPRLVFVNSMSDLFHEEVPFEFVDRVWNVMTEASHHTFQVLTKRPEIASKWATHYLAEHGSLGANVWLGVSIENSRYTFRADVLRTIPATVHFISAEPLLGSLYASGTNRRPLDLTGIDWLIAGGESGARSRPVDVRWVRELRDGCRDAGVAFFFKQWGGRTAKAGGRELDGRIFDEMPRAATG
ncbi:Bacteriophage protein gp37 [Gaiella occulta]|uniref:Bacteriophage protein gp37 n=1 Tax=Gaiella occulta TaxID=1002870 RepID=A0A7M2YSM3_9ACTN|nr:phage Gp37/Gp68 family protein [Gaiella occulta]RDI73173.1 Bacteriophage protein gp37 [Gaiella occulta]